MRALIGELLKVLLAVLIPLASFATGIAPRTSTKRLWHRPRELTWALLAVLVAVPLWVVVLVKLLPLSPMVRGGLLVATLSVGIGPVAGMKRMSGVNRAASDALDLNLVVLVLSMLYVPIAFVAVAALFGVSVPLGLLPVAKVVLGRALVPLLIGVGLAQAKPAWAAHAAAPLAKILNAALLVIVVVALAALWNELGRVGSAGWLAAVAAAAGAIVIGHLLGGPDPITRGVVAVASVMRFPALSLTLASALPEGKRFVPEVLVYVLVAFGATSLYGLLMGRKERRRPRLVVARPAAPRTV
jgi:BASS family bile acid:Na+ symporter